ncbi:MAG: caspase family protein [Gemmataceae bacterium]
MKRIVMDLSMNRGANKWFLGLTLAVMWATASVAEADNKDAMPDCHVLAIGVDNYEDPRAKLSGCVNDAQNLAQRLKDQERKVFADVNLKVLLDDAATGKGIETGMAWLGNQGKSGDFVVLVLSGHGGRKNGQWYFVAQDHRQVKDTAILSLADKLAAQGKKVVIIVDACHAGELRIKARALMVRYRNPAAGGIILMTSSMGSQTSTALGRYSAYAQAVNEGLAGSADLDGDGFITLGELRRFAFHRTHALVRRTSQPEQDGECEYSLSLSENVKLAVSTVQTVFETEGRLTGAEPKDRVRKTSNHQLFIVKLEKGVKYTTNLVSSDFDAFLRLENEESQQIAEDDDSGGDRNAQLIFTATYTGYHRVIVTTYERGGVGAFSLTMSKAR